VLEIYYLKKLLEGRLETLKLSREMIKLILRVNDLNCRDEI